MFIFSDFLLTSRPHVGYSGRPLLMLKGNSIVIGLKVFPHWQQKKMMQKKCLKNIRRMVLIYSFIDSFLHSLTITWQGLTTQGDYISISAQTPDGVNKIPRLWQAYGQMFRKDSCSGWRWKKRKAIGSKMRREHSRRDSRDQRPETT